MFNAINHTRKEEFCIFWDLGRRCTYDCSYCSAYHHNKFSPIISFDQLSATIDGAVEYANLYNLYRKEPTTTDIAFTGGEPTIHPDFFKFIKYVKQRHPQVTTNLTTNGCYTNTKCKQIIEYVSNATISYHPEATQRERDLVISNIKLMHESKYNFRINLMFHKDYFDHCMELADWFKENGIRYTARPIGDSNNKEDIERGFAHEYNDEQLEYFKNQWEKKETKKTNTMQMATTGMSIPKIGRPCCNGKCLNVKTGNDWSREFRVPSTNFNGWSCMVNWNFLYINSELDLVYTHQTCMVNLDGQVGPLGKASDFKTINKDLQNKLRSGKMPVIRCPKTHCGCGLCSPKALHDNDAKEIFNANTKYLEPVLQNETKNLDMSQSWSHILLKKGIHQ